MSSAEDTPPPRPYTEYNIFFQIERAYILQNLGVKPNINKDNIFSSETDPSYTGPELPSRYDGIILPGDWYIPGKGRRKKRQHRASHGKISFTDLSKSISSAWRNIDDETKLFCAKLSDAGNQEYRKKIMQRSRRISDASATPEMKAAAIKYAESSSSNKKKQKKMVADIDKFSQNTQSSSTGTTSTSLYDVPHGNNSRFNWSPDFIFSGFPAALPHISTVRSVSHTSVPPPLPMAAPTSSVETKSELDLSDDDILGMYMRS